MAEQTSDTPTEETSVPADVVAPTNGARDPAPPRDEAPGAGAQEAPAAEAAGAHEAPAAEAAGADEAPAGDQAGVRIVPAPGRGPVVLADERGKPEPRPPTAPRRRQAAPKAKPQRPRRRKRSAAERHRAVFFARLNELRRGEQTDDSIGKEADAQGAGQPAVEGPPTEAPVAEAPVAEAQEAEHPSVAEPVPEEPVVEEAEQPAGDLTPTGAQPAGGGRAAPGPPVSQARLAAAIQRVGGPGVVEEALRPKTDEQGERKKWALVCCEAAQGRQAGDPEFTAWLRLAATPVREIKASLPVREEPGRGGGRRGGGPGRGGERPPREGGGERGRGGDRARSGRGDRVSREELESFARGGKLTSKVRIVDPAAEKRERERQRKEERERKRQAERDRLARLGY